LRVVHGIKAGLFSLFFYSDYQSFPVHILILLSCFYKAIKLRSLPNNILRNTSFEDVLEDVRPDELSSDEAEEESAAWSPTIVETDKDRTSESPTSESSFGEMPAEVAA